MESITKSTEAAARGLENASSIDHRREAIKRSGMRVELDNDDKNRCVRPVFISPDLSLNRNTLRIACALGSQTSLPPTIYRKRIILPRRARRNTGSAS